MTHYTLKVENVCLLHSHYWKEIRNRLLWNPEFLRQEKQYKDSVLPTGVRTVVIEAGSKLGWEGFVYNDNYLITVDHFGASGTKDEVLEFCKFDYETIKNILIYNLRYAIMTP